ncbi:MAG: hypothetical protein GY786_04510, partial [Proteobacteria bacterium]|nr:hypothetical protein [Pseudomonadota bacterium]
MIFNKKYKGNDRRKFRRKTSFKVTIIQIFSSLILITIFGMSTTYYYRSTDIVLDLSDRIAREVTGKIIERTTNYVGTPAIQTKAISNLVDDSNIIKNHKTIWKYAWQQLLAFPQIQSIFVADIKGSYVQVRREPRLATRTIDRSIKKPIEKWFYRDKDYNIIGSKVKSPTFEPRSRPWYKNTKADPRIYWTDVYVFTTAKTPGISASYPVLDDNGKFVGVTVLNTPLHSLSGFLRKQKVSKNSVVFIANSNNELLAYPDPEETTSRIDNKSGKRRLSFVSELKNQWVVDAYNNFRAKKASEEKGLHNNLWYSILFESISRWELPSMQDLFLYPDRNLSISKTKGENYITYAAPFPKSFASKWEIFIVLPED